MDGKDGAQDRSGHLHGPAGPGSHSGGSDAERETQPKSGYGDGAGSKNATSHSGGSEIEGKEEKGYTGSSMSAAATVRTKDGVGSPLPSAK